MYLQTIFFIVSLNVYMVGSESSSTKRVKLQKLRVLSPTKTTKVKTLFEEANKTPWRSPSKRHRAVTVFNVTDVDEKQKKMDCLFQQILQALNVSNDCTASHCWMKNGDAGTPSIPGNHSASIAIFLCGNKFPISEISQVHFCNWDSSRCDLLEYIHEINSWQNHENISCVSLLRSFVNSNSSTTSVVKTEEKEKESSEIGERIYRHINGEIKTICMEFNTKGCQCQWFNITYQNFSMNLCNTVRLPSGSIIFSDTKSEDSWIPHLQQRTCNHFNLTDNTCRCKNMFLRYQNKKRDICTEQIKGTFHITTLQELCMIFQVAPENCTCQKFIVKDTPFSSFCEYKDSINGSLTITRYDRRYVLPYAFVGTLSAIVGIIGNGVVLMMSLKFRNNLSTCKKLFAHLATSDFLFAFLQLLYFVPKFWSVRWIYGESMCKLLRGTERLGAMMAIGIILIISVERYIGILEPFQRGISKNGLLWILSANVLIAIASVIPVMYYNTLDRAQLCRTIWPDLQRGNKIYHLYLFHMYFLIPVIIISILYTRIILNLRGTVIFGNSNWIADPRLRKKRIIDNRRTMYVLLAVVVAFVVLVLPTHLVYLYFDFAGLNGDYAPKDKIEKSTYFGLLYFALFPYPLHVAINPFIYCLIDSKWRSDMVHLLLMIPKRARAYSTTLTTSILARRSSTTIRRRSSSAAVLATPEEIRIQKFNSSNCLKISDAELTPGVTPEVTPRQKHFSDSSAKSAMSEYSFDANSPDPFAP